MAPQSPGLAAEIKAMRKVDEVLTDTSLPEATRRRVFRRMVEEFGPVFGTGPMAYHLADGRLADTSAAAGGRPDGGTDGTAQ